MRICTIASTVSGHESPRPSDSARMSSLRYNALPAARSTSLVGDDKALYFFGGANKHTTHAK